MAVHGTTPYEPTTRFGKWMDERLPIGRTMHAQFIDFPTPRNINYLWTFGGISPSA
jgi:ubiquinol-cytochrome c reductase cytochrome b subunit